MPSHTVEERLEELEAKVARLLDAQYKTKPPTSWLERHFGAFEDNPYYDAAMERGAEYRRSQPTAADENDEAGTGNDPYLSSGH